MCRSASVLTCLLAGLAGLSGTAWSAAPKEPSAFLDQKEFFKPELYISSSHEPLERVISLLPNQADWRAFRQARQDAGEPPVPAFIDPRSGAATSLMGAFPVIPGTGFGNAITLEEVGNRLGRQVRAIDGRTVAEAARSLVLEHQQLLSIDAAQLGEVRAVEINPDLWQVSIPQTYHGIPVRHGRLVASISHGNVVVVGTETWGNVRGLSPKAKLTADEALQAGFHYAGGRSAMDEILREPTLEVIPIAPQEHQQGEAFAGPLGFGYRHRLVWTFVFQRPPDGASWEVLVDAHGGEILAFQDINHYANSQITGGVYPLTNTEACPNAATCGTMQNGWPMPFADTGLPAPNAYTNSAGVFNYGGGTVTTTLTGQYVRIKDACGEITNSSVTGSLNLGGINGQHDCTSAGGSPGNTAAARSAYYEINKLAEQARGWLPGNQWLKGEGEQGRLTAWVNYDVFPQLCYASTHPDGSSIFFTPPDNDCRNPGEIAGVIDHEWGHALDKNDANLSFSNSSEAYADIAAIYRLQTSCIGHGLYSTRDSGCGQTSDGNGFNANEAQQGAAHCDRDCSGFRDADYLKHSPNTPDTALGFVCTSCNAGPGPCGKQAHCAATPSRQAAWDLVAHDLRQSPFYYDSQTAFLIGNKLFYQGSGNIGEWHSCSCGTSSHGCGATNAYMQWLTADDNNGNLNDGTPHMMAIYNAFARHGIACPTPAPQNSGCPGGPGVAPTLTVGSGSYQALLSWNTIPGATSYWVFRTEGHAGCNYGKALIAKTTGTTYTDSQVANGRNYYYNVVAAGSSSACFSPVSNCAAATPTPTAVEKDAEVLSQSVPSTMAAGQSSVVSITLKNTGTVTWSPVGPQCGAYRLGSINPYNNTTWGVSRVELPGSVPPGGEVTLPFTVTVPSTPGTYNFQWRMVHECVEWFGDASPNVAVNVVSPPPLPVASFTFFCTGPYCTFDGSGSTGTGLTYFWDFGDSSTPLGSGVTTAHGYSNVPGITAYTATLTVTDSLGRQAFKSKRVSVVNGGLAPAPFYFAVAPCRILDTRNTTILTNAQPRVVNIAGLCGIPSTAKAVSFNVTAVSPTGSGQIRLYPGDLTASWSGARSSINFAPATSPRANSAVISLATNNTGTLGIYPEVSGSSGQVHLVLDVQGYFSADWTPAPGAQGPLRFQTLPPCRMADTRPSSPLVAGTVRTFTAQGVCGMPVGAAVASLHIGVPTPASGGYITLFPSNITRPIVSTINFQSGILNLRNGARVNLSSTTPDLAAYFGGPVGTSVHAYFDVNGYFKSDAPLHYQPLIPCRAVDSAILVTGTVTTFQIRGNCGVPVHAQAALLRLVVAAPTSSGELTVYPSDLPLSGIAVSTVKFDANEPGLSMGTIVPLSTLADDIAASPGQMITGGTVVLSIEVFGYFY